MNGAGDFLQVPDSPSLEITGPLTVLVWANANAVNDNYAMVYKATSWDDGQMAYMLDLDWASGGYYPRFGVSSDGYASGYAIVVSHDALTPGQWHLIAGVYDGTNLMVYLDGQLEDSIAYSAGIYPGTDPLCIGWNWNGTWKGALDEVRILNVALSPADILEEFQSQQPVLNSSLPGFFGRVGVGQAWTNQVTVNDTGASELDVAPLLVSGPDAAYFQVLTPSSGFELQPGLTNSVTAQVRFAPDAVRTYSALLTINSSANSISIPLAGQGVNDKTFSLDLQQRDDSGEITVTQQTFHGSQLAALVVDTWNSHPDSEMASRTASLVPRMNQALDAARDLGITVIFCPSDCLADYDGTSYRNDIMNLRYHPQPGDNGFNPPVPPYNDSGAGDMVPPNKSVPAYPMWTHQHPDLVMKPGDLASLDMQEIYNYCVENGITSLIYMGVAANICVPYRPFGMVPMKRYCNLEPIMVRDLTDSMTLNGRSPADYAAVDLTMTPDRGHREVTAFDEQYICSTIDAAQLMQQWAPSAYSRLISSQPDLLCYWRLDSKSGYRECLDIQRVQSCWWYDQTNGLGFDVAGAIVQSPDTALQFKGSTTVLISPIYRGYIPTNSPLVSLSSTNFTLEAWVQPAALDANQWLFAHDNGLSNGVDVLLGLDASNHFQFIVGTDAQGDGYGDVLESATTVTPDDVTSNRWFHVVAEHDVVQGTVSLYVNGELDSQGIDVCQPVSLALAPHLGSRGTVSVDATGTLSDPGFDFLQGTLDEVAIYTAPLDSDVVRLHYQTAQNGDSVVVKATPTATLVVSNPLVMYDGTAQAAAVGIMASSVPGTVANILIGGAISQTNAGTYAVTADFVPDDSANYNSLTGLAAGDFVIEKATPTATLAVNNTPVIYDGTAQSAAAGLTASSVPGTVANILTGGAASQTGAGTYAVTADFVPDDSANYNSLLAQPAGDFVIAKATPMATLAVNNTPVMYDGTAQSATAGLTASSVPGTVANILSGGAASQTGAGTYAVTADFVPDDSANYNSLTGLAAGEFVIAKAAVTISSGITADDKVYDGGTSATISSNSVILEGVLAADVGQVDLSTNGYVATFDGANAGSGIGVTVSGLSLTGDKAGDYLVTQPTGLTAAIAKATPTATLAVNNSPVTYNGTAHAASVGIAVSSAPGTVANILTGGEASQTGAGTYAVTADFVPDDSANYNSVAGLAAGTFVIQQAGSDMVLVSSQNPSLQSSNVGFTATVTSVAPGLTTPTGNVQFYTNAVAFGDLVALTDGVAVLNTADLPAGATRVKAVYAGDGNYLSSVSSVDQVVHAIQNPITVGIENNGDGSVTVSYSGTPGARYIVQAKSDLGLATDWENVSTNTAGTDGKWTITESIEDHPARFYRSFIP